MRERRQAREAARSMRAAARGAEGGVRSSRREARAGPELERMRRQARHRGRIALARIVGYPAIVGEVVLLLVVTGAVQGHR